MLPNVPVTRWRAAPWVLVLALLLSGASAAADSPRILQRQVPLPSDPAQPLEVTVAEGYSTTLLLPAVIAAEGLQSTVSTQEALRPRVQGRMLILTPQRLPSTSGQAWLHLTLVDRTRVSLRLTSRPGLVDGRVEIVRSESPEQAKSRFLAAELERCRGEPAAELLLRLALQERERPDSGLRLLRLPASTSRGGPVFLQALHAEVLGWTLLLVELRNDDPDVAWAPERAALVSRSTRVIEIEAFQAWPPLVPPGETVWVGLSWRHPRDRAEPFHLSLLGNGDTQVVEARDLRLEGGPP